MSKWKIRFQTALIFLLISNLFLSNEKNADTLISSNNMVSNEPYLKQRTGQNLDNFNEFTFSGWIQIKELYSINILSILDKSDEKFERKVTDCPLSEDYLLKNPVFYNLAIIKKNPNCMKSNSDSNDLSAINSTINLLRIDLVIEQEMNFLQFSLFNGVVPIALFLPPLKKQNYIYFAITFSAKTGEIEFGAKLIGDIYFQNQTRILVSQDSIKLHGDFLISSNTRFAQVPKSSIILFELKDLTFFPFYTNKFEQLSLVQPFFSAIDKSLQTEIIDFKNLNEKKSYFWSQNIIQNKTMSSFSYNFLNELQEFIDSPTIIFQINVTNSSSIKTYTLGTFSFEHASESINFYIEKDKKQANYFHIKANITTAKYQNVFSTKKIEMSFFNYPIICSVIFYPNKFVSIYFSYNLKHEYLTETVLISSKIKSFQTPEINQSYFQLFSAKIEKSVGEIILSRLEKSKKHKICAIQSNLNCFYCEKGILNFNQNKCERFCSENGTIIDNQCFYQISGKLKQNTKVEFLQISHNIANQITLNFNQKLSNIFNFENNTQILIELVKENKTLACEFFQNTTSEKSLELKIKPLKTQRNSQVKMTFALNHTFESTNSYNFERIFKTRIVRSFLETFSTLQSIIGILIVFIFYLYLIMAFIILFIGIDNCKNEFIVKKIIRVFQCFQLLFLISFSGIPVSDIFLKFIESINKNTNILWNYSFSLINFSFQLNTNIEFVNFSSNEFVKMALTFFMRFLLFQTLFCLFYIFVGVLFHYRDYFEAKWKEILFKIIDQMEFNLIILFVLLFSIPTCSFLGIFLNGRFYNKIEYYTFILSFLLLVFVIFLFSTSFFAEIKKGHYFLQMDFRKLKFSNLFIGYKNSKFANLYEVFQIILSGVFSFSTTLLMKNYQVQTIIMLSLLFVQFYMLIWKKPFDKITDFWCEVFLQGIFLLSYFLFFLLHIFDLFGYKIEALEDRLTVLLIIAFGFTFLINFVKDGFNFYFVIRGVRYEKRGFEFDAKLKSTSEDYKGSFNFKDILSGETIEIKEFEEKEKTSFGRLGKLGSTGNVVKSFQIIECDIDEIKKNSKNIVEDNEKSRIEDSGISQSSIDVQKSDK